MCRYNTALYYIMLLYNIELHDTIICPSFAEYTEISADAVSVVGMNLEEYSTYTH